MATMTDHHSHYLHTSLYTFNEKARATVLTRFNDAVKDITIQCYYDTAHDIFYLKCPRGSGDQGDRGPAADAALAKIIGDYVQQELTPGRDELPNVVRFPHSNFDALDSFHHHDTTPPQHAVDDKTIRTHIIMVGEKEGKLVKLFPIYELNGFGLLERSLAPRNARTQQIFSKGLTCRAAVWHPTNGHVFNGRTGKDKKLLGSGDEAALLRLPEFPKLFDDRAGADPALNDMPISSTWEFNGRPPTTVQQWLNGMGDIVQVEPGARPDLPKDAKKLIAQEQAHVTGRARVPKGANVVASDTEEESEEESSDGSDVNRRAGGFAALLHGNAQARRNKEEHSDTDSDSDYSENSEQVQPQSFQNLLLGGKDLKAKEPAHNAPSDGWNRAVKEPGASSGRPHLPSNDETGRMSLQIHRSASPKPSRSTDQSLPETKANEGWAEYGKQYAKVDSIGLAGNPCSTAKWDHEHAGVTQSPRKSKKGVPVIARPPPSLTSVSHAPSGADTNMFGPQSTAAPSNSDVPSTFATERSIRNYSEWDPREAIWINRPIPGMSARDSKLVDDTAPVSARPARAPPGFLARAAAPKQPTFAPASADKLIDVETDLMDDEYPPMPVVRLPPRPPMVLEPLPAEPGRSYAAATLDHANDLPIERIQQMPKHYATKFSTMHKAGRKMNSKSQRKAAGKKFTAQLELPEPTPPPKPSKKKEGNPIHQESATMVPLESKARIQDAMTKEDESTSLPHLSSSRRITKENHSFGQVLVKEKQKQIERYEESDTADTSRVKLVCQFGMLLVRPDESCWSKLSHQSHDPLDLQASFREYSQYLRTDFSPRITASTMDAKYLITLGTGAPVEDSTAACQYEIYIRDTANTILKVTMRDANKEGVSITTPEQIVAEASAHFAVHVWDARFLLVQSGDNSKSSSIDAIKDFITSLATDQNAPSFRAHIPNGLFSVLRVVAKRSFSHVSDGLKYTVTEVHDLVCESLETNRHNFRALCLAKEDMVAEQRLWWEASWETMGLAQADTLQAKVNAMVPEMDVVGLGNEGPWIFKENHRDDVEEMEVPEIPFW